MTDLSLVIPLYNEESRLPKLFEILEKWLNKRREIIFADDGSQDKSHELCLGFAARHPKNVQAIRLDVNEGKGGAVRAGILVARGETIIFTDADCPYGVAVFDQIYQSLKDSADICLGSRDHSASTMESYGILRRLASTVFRLWVRSVASCGSIRDTQCGVKGFRRDAARLLFEGLSTRDFCFDIEFIALAHLMKFKMDIVPVQLKRNEGSSLLLRRDVPRMFVGAWRANRSAKARFRILREKAHNPSPQKFG